MKFKITWEEARRIVRDPTLWNGVEVNDLIVEGEPIEEKPDPVEKVAEHLYNLHPGTRWVDLEVANARKIWIAMAREAIALGLDPDKLPEEK